MEKERVYNGTEPGAAQRPDGLDQRQDPASLSLEFEELLRRQANTPIGALILRQRR